MRGLPVFFYNIYKGQKKGRFEERLGILFDKSFFSLSLQSGTKVYSPD